jgi:transcriptional regulator with XRE-family HTH domain
MTQRDVAAAMDWSQSKLIRIESGAVNISTNDLRVLLGHYGVDSSRIDVLVGVARAAREPTRWSVYKDVATPDLIAFLGYESSASIIRSFEPLLVPGLLQTEEYARAVISVIEDNSQKIDPLVDLRMERQELLVRDPAPNLHFVMDEAAIRRMVGGRDVMRGQLRHLRRLMDHPNITIRIVPFEQGMYPRLQVAYWLFEFPDPEDEYVLYIENQPRGGYLVREGSPEEEDVDSPVRYMAIFWELWQRIAHRDNTLCLLEDALTGLTDERFRATSAGKAVGTDVTPND